jgi:hypothetical protein
LFAPSQEARFNSLWCYVLYCRLNAQLVDFTHHRWPAAGLCC